MLFDFYDFIKIICGCLIVKRNEYFAINMLEKWILS